MDEQTAKLIIAAGFAVGLVVWLIALNLYRKMADAPSIDPLTVRISGKTPEEAMKSVIEGAARLGPQVRLSRPSDNSLQIALGGVAARIDAQRAGGQAMLVAEIDDAALRRKMQTVMAVLVVLVMPLVVAGVPAALWQFAAPSPAPAARWQCVQVLQIVHALWPPFLVYFLWKKQRDMARDAISNLFVLAET
jgi:hypothetical protein